MAAFTSRARRTRMATASAALAPDGQTLALGVVNRHPDAAVEAELRLVEMRLASEGMMEWVDGPSITARNSCEQPDLVSVTKGAWEAGGVRPTCTFRPHSLTMLTIPLH